MTSKDRAESEETSSGYGSISRDVDAVVRTDFDGHTSVDVTTTTSGAEFKEIGRNAAPLMITFLLQMSLSFMTVVSVGRLNALDLGGVSLANVTFTATSAIFQGLATCLDTLCPQAYGSKRYQLVGLYFQRCVAISTLFAVPIALLWWFSAHALRLVVDDPRLVVIAARYLRVMVSSIPGYIIFECGKKYLQAQNDFTTGQYILFVCAPLNAFFNYLLVFRLGMGYIGAPIATSVTFMLMGISIVAYIWYQKGRNGDMDCWNPMCNWRPIFSNWEPMISLAVPGIVMIEAEFLAFESLTILSAKFGTEALAAQSVVASIQTLTFQVPFSTGVAASNRIAYHIGKKRINDCRIATKTTIIQIGVILAIANFLFLVLGRKQVSTFFSKDEGVVALAVQILPIIGVNQFADVFNVLAAGVLRAQGRQRIGGILNILAYYVVGLPVAVTLGFYTDLGVKGFWIGLGCGIFVLSIGEVYCVWNSNWSQIIHDSHLLHKSTQGGNL
ncbi:LANO_0A03268g1_1 [Lachancea nothofagi CBS 11611]|uniref:LANO_0A03268g1_1 n=1 Tax=Lachancea nothofagi CBS 11611 TaxID=1266666 RepID=A0A1G4IPA3_9SACH|nr:LANO_0A03268g1_1 [Lachancea nothofagi CBS 11611]